MFWTERGRHIFMSIIVLGSGLLSSTALPQEPSLDSVPIEPTLQPRQVDKPPRSIENSPRDASVDAPVLQWIQIDGDLSDWPAAMPRHSIRNLLPGGAHGTGEEVDLTTSPDLSAVFMVGYDPRKQVVYLAVIVRDDELVVGHKTYLDTDALEVYIDGLHGERAIPRPQKPEPWYEHVSLSDLPVQQYVAIPGKGPVYGMSPPTNPALVAGDVRKTRTRVATRRKGDITTYEWAIQVFDRYPDQPTKLGPGKRIGFDLSVVDKDVPAPPEADFLPTPGEPLEEPLDARVAWIYWGPRWRGMKVLNAGNLGEIVLGK
jgi:hypothetical protein